MENETFDVELLNKYGITYSMDTSNCDTNELFNQGYNEVSYSNLSKLNMILQQMPGFVTTCLNSIGTYHIKYDKSIGTLQKSKNNPNWIRGNIVNDNNQIVAQAEMSAVSSIPTVINAAFSVMSIVTGQYFLSEINDKLGDLGNKIDNIYQFLETDKRSKLAANEQYLLQTLNSIEYIKNNDILKNTVLLHLHQIRIESISHIEFYSEISNSKKLELNTTSNNTKDAFKDIPNIVLQIENAVIPYKRSIYLYFLTFYIEFILLDTTDNQFIENAKNDVFSKINNYKEFIYRYEDKLTAITNSQVYLPNNMLNIINAFKNPTGENIGKAILSNSNPIALTISIWNNKKTNIAKEKERIDIINHINALANDCKNFEYFNKIEDAFANYSLIVNNTELDLLYTQNKLYYKFNKTENQNNISSDKLEEK